MKRAIALVLASLALAFAQETKVGGSPADATTMAEPELAADGHPVGYIRNPMLKVLCSPTTTALGQPFYATFEFFHEFKRPMIIHLDLLNADTKQWITGDSVEVTGSAGKVTLRIDVPQNAQGFPFKWYAYMAPQNENYPNMLATTTFEAPLGARVENPCAPIRNSARDPSQPLDFNYVLMQSYPSGFKAGAATEVSVQYNLLPGSEPTYVSASLLKSSDHSVVAHAQVAAEEGEHTVRVPMDVPFGATTEPVYLTAILKPAGKAFSERLAEDRVWSTAVYNGRRNKLRG